MAPCPSRHSDQTIGPFFNRFMCKAVVDDVMQDHTTRTMRRVVQPFLCAQGRDPQWHLVLDANLYVALETGVGFMHDLVHRIGGGGIVGVGLVVTIQLFLDARQPAVQLDRLPFCFACIQRRKAAHDTGLALCNHQIRVRDNEQRAANQRDTQIVEKGG